MAAENQGRAGLQHLSAFIFERELHEVILLLDHISGRWDKDMPGATGPDPLGIIEKICEIALCPEGDRDKCVEHAVAVLDAKDKLNAVARPASGMTIAFTLLVVGDENRRRIWGRWRRRLRSLLFDGAAEAARTPGERAPDCNEPARIRPTRMTLARYAFPGLIEVAERFKRRIVLLVSFLLLALVATCILSWHVTAGNVMLEHLEAVKLERAKLQLEIAAAEMRLTTESRTRQTDVETVVRFCYEPLATEAEAKAKSTEEYQLCKRQDDLRAESRAIRQNLRAWLVPWKSLYGALFTFDPDSAEVKGASGSGDMARRRGTEELSRIVSLVVGTAVLPLLYGVLGAGAAVVRRLWERMRESMLSPRDSTMALLQLALGATVGACIALFISPSGPVTTGDPGLIGSWGLSSSALSFIAGFGVEGVFRALESFIHRVFNITDPARKP